MKTRNPEDITYFIEDTKDKDMKYFDSGYLSGLIARYKKNGLDKNKLSNINSILVNGIVLVDFPEDVHTYLPVYGMFQPDNPVQYVNNNQDSDTYNTKQHINSSPVRPEVLSNNVNNSNASLQDMNMFAEKQRNNNNVNIRETTVITREMQGLTLEEQNQGYQPGGM